MRNLIKNLIKLLGSAKQRYESKHAIINTIAALNGFRLYNKNLSWQQDDEYKKIWSLFPSSDKNIHERKFNFFNIAKSICNIPGDLAECGVFSGASSHLMLAATAKTKKYLHGFDSFHGLSEPKSDDLVLIDHVFKWKKHDMIFDIKQTHANLKQHQGRYTLYKGWIPDRFSEVSNKIFSLVHIDVDLYEPTMASLEFFYPRLSVGGIIVCDDYGFKSCPGARKAMDSFISDKPESKVIHLTTGQGIIIRQKN